MGYYYEYYLYKTVKWSAFFIFMFFPSFLFPSCFLPSCGSSNPNPYGSVFDVFPAIHVLVGCHVASWQAHFCLPAWGPPKTETHTFLGLNILFRDVQKRKIMSELIIRLEMFNVHVNSYMNIKLTTAKKLLTAWKKIKKY